MIGTPRQKGQIALYTFSLLAATVGIIGRLAGRRVTRTKWQMNDYLMIAAYTNVVGLVIVAYISVIDGELGARSTELTIERLLEIKDLSMKNIVIIPPLLISSSIFVKMSITHFYITLFPYTLLSRICKVQLYLLTLCWFGLVIPCFFVCTPLAKMWDHSILHGKCFDLKKFWLASSIVALVFDLSCVVLPIPTFWRLKTTTAKKIKLTVLFSLGFFICFLSICRTIYDEFVTFDENLIWTASPVVIFAVPEPSLGVLAGCAPMMVPLYKRARKSMPWSVPSSRATTAFSPTRPSFNSAKPLPPLPSIVTQVSSSPSSIAAVPAGKFAKLRDDDVAPLASIHVHVPRIKSVECEVNRDPVRSSPIERSLSRMREAAWVRDLSLARPLPRFGEVSRGSVSGSVQSARTDGGFAGITVLSEITVEVDEDGESEKMLTGKDERSSHDFAASRGLG